MSTYGIDGHKLHLHPERVAQWMQGENIYPIYMEISPSGACNHRCVFCTMDYMGYTPRFLPTAIMAERLKEMGRLGVKSIMFAGEGEPLLHKDIALLSRVAYEASINISFTTNGVLLDPELARQLLPLTSWIKVSCNAGTPEQYAAVHRTGKEEFKKVMLNFSTAVDERSRTNAACTLGFQSVLLPENQDSMVNLAQTVRELGADYLVIKPYTHNPQSLKEGRNISYTDCEDLAVALRAEERENFAVVFRHEAMNRWNSKTNTFDRCLALPFWGYIDSAANIRGCLRHLKNDQFSYGNLEEQSFESIWQGTKRLSRVDWCVQNFDVQACHVTCRMETINNYLWRLQHPGPHDTFI